MITIENGVTIQNGSVIENLNCDPVWANTVFLCHFDGTNNQTGVLTDNSAANTIIQTYGTAALSTTQKYFGTTSLYLDGSGYVKPDYPSGTSPSYDLGTITTSTNLTVEFYARYSVIDSNERVFVAHGLPGSGGNGVGGWSVGTTDSGKIFFSASKNSTAGTGWYARYITDNVVISSTSTWYYITVMITNGVPSIYVDGVLQASSFLTTTSAYATSIIGFNTTRTTYGIIVGALDSDSTNPAVSSYFSGYIDDMRLTTNIARYNANYSTPTLAFPNSNCLPGDPYWVNTVLLCHFDGANASPTFIDSSSYGRTITRAGAAQLSTAQSVFGQSSGLFDGSGDYCAAPVSTDFDYTSTDFTMEAYVKLVGYSSSYAGVYEVMIVSTWNASSNPNGWQFGISGTVSSYTDVTFYDGTTTFYFPNSFALNTWYNVAVTRSGSSIRAFVNGTQVGTTQTSTGACDGATELRIANLNDPVYRKELNGYMDELRMTKSVARYTSSYTIATNAFPNY
jgi:hypothetical protein